MIDKQTLTHPKILDAEALHEFSDALSDRAAEIERDMAKLSKAPGDRGIIADIFRALHNIKGDAALCRVPMAGMVAHPLESLLTRVRSGEIAYTPLLGEVILLTIDRLELAIDALMAGRSLEHLKLVALVEGLEQMSRASQQHLDPDAAQLVQAVTGYLPQTAAQRSASAQSAARQKLPVNSASDLKFFHSLALQLETRSPFFSGRTGRIHQLALDTNRIAKSPVDETQLEAALYLHDVGMMFLPESVWLKTGKISSEERILMHAHPELAAGILDRMEGWQAAAEMVRQHHEAWDGSGYPDGRYGEQICQGAKILAIVDAFEAVMLKHSTRGQSSSIMRAIAEINACEKQFAPELIEPFNRVIRKLLEHH